MSSESGDSTEQNEVDTNEKGDRHERQAVRILSRLYRAERVPSIYGNNDPFRLADVMGIQGGRPFAIVQVKTNSFTAEQRRKYRSKASRKVDGKHTILEVWVRIDRNGWRMHRFDPDEKEFEEYYRTTTCDPGKVRDEWAEEFEKYSESKLVTDGGTAQSSSEWFRCWCDECDWEDTIKGKEASASLINLGHGVPTGHSKVYREPTDAPVRGPTCSVCGKRADNRVGGEFCCGNVLCQITLRGEAENLRLAIFGTPQEISDNYGTDTDPEGDDD